MQAEMPVSENRWTEAHVPDQSGRVAIVTGANTGLGFDTARVLAEKGAIVVLAVRDTQRGADAADRIRATAPRADLRVQQLDLGSLASVRSAAASLLTSFPRIDLLINNAGVMIPLKGYPKLVASSARSHDSDAQQRLWSVSERLTGVAFPV
jgi:NAD(P)-dependent dehydrogenase (short-subunit alcohol dehydrogenase family)